MDPTTIVEHPEDASTGLDTAYRSAYMTVRSSDLEVKIDKGENTLGVPGGTVKDAYERLNEFYAQNATTINGALSVVHLDSKSIENKILMFAETSKILMGGLDVLAEVHPFVKLAVIAFKGVIGIELTRRDNNRKVQTILVQMQDMMTVLFQLQNMHDPETKGPSGAAQTERFSDLVKKITTDITSCGSFFNMYSKKGFLSKALKSKIYESELTKYATIFIDRKNELGYALKVHTAIGVDEANRKLNRVEEMVEALFSKFETSREKELRTLIESHGGAKACIDNDSILTELLKKSGESLSLLDLNDKLATVKRLMNKELSQDLNEAFKRNAEQFERKLDVQSEQLADTISHGLGQTEKHIISAMRTHAEKIHDLDLRTLWGNQDWKGSVKARHFVLLLHDYFMEMFNNARSAAGSVGGSAPVSPVASGPALPTDTKPLQDESWALAYINVTYVQPILEAVDDDGTGFISIKEVNYFAGSRGSLSLLSWVAFWAAGWHMSVTWYKNRIYSILTAMYDLVEHIKPANVQGADKYLRSFVWMPMLRVELLLRSTRSAANPAHQDARLVQITRTIHDSEEKKLREKLDRLVYELDDITTLRLITGPRRIERYVYPLLFLLLKRHYDIMQLACKYILADSEWEVMNTSLATVFQAVDERTKNLEAIFKATSSDVKERLGNFAFGMFQLSYGELTRDPINNTIYSFQLEDGYADNDEAFGSGLENDETKKIPGHIDDDEVLAAGSEADAKTKKFTEDPKETDILLYETENELTSVYNFETIYPPPHPPMLFDVIDGAWTGHLRYAPDGDVTAATNRIRISMVLMRTGDELSGGAEDCFAILAVGGTVDSASKVVLRINWPDGYWVECMGQYDPEEDTIAGGWAGMQNATEFSSATYPFIFSRTTSSIFRYTKEYPRRLSKKRSTERKQFIELEKRNIADLNGLATPWDPLDATEKAELYRLRTDLRSCDSRFYCTMAEFELHLLTYFDCRCDSCKRDIRGIRLYCIQCMDDKYSGDHIDLCIHCINETPERAPFVHKESHVLVKTLRCIHDSELAWVIKKAGVLAAQVKKSFNNSHTEGATELEARPATTAHFGFVLHAGMRTSVGTVTPNNVPQAERPPPTLSIMHSF
ncbi:Protein kinase domain-containing protein [Mycena venus]|uniref:Protein kinase domain-containing protein n=1 Tax=Mycena venus TaxID=2733690 RepID=A0A8H6TVX0_9AGAR|nr:Protein kinase domain-containing protein [Mycena venus]